MYPTGPYRELRHLDFLVRRRSKNGRIPRDLRDEVALRLNSLRRVYPSSEIYVGVDRALSALETGYVSRVLLSLYRLRRAAQHLAYSGQPMDSQQRVAELEAEVGRLRLSLIHISEPTRPY